MKNLSLAFIGGGNMARSLIGGLIADGHDPHRIWVADADGGQLALIQQRFPVHTTLYNSEAAGHADVIVLAVKPQVMQVVARELASTVQARRPLIISIAAGIPLAALQAWLGGGLPMVRAMPNTPALVQSGATALFAGAEVSGTQHNHAESILRAVGLVLWLDEEAHMDAVTALSGSGPAYFFLLMEILENVGSALGLPRRTARLLTMETALGAARMVLEAQEDPATLRARVTSPGGTTEAALHVLEQGHVRELFHSALQAARDRSAELATQLGGHDD